MVGALLVLFRVIPCVPLSNTNIWLSKVYVLVAAVNGMTIHFAGEIAAMLLLVLTPMGTLSLVFILSV